MTKAALDHETKRSYTVTVRATDPTNASDMISVTISVDGRAVRRRSSAEAPLRLTLRTARPRWLLFTARDPERDGVMWTLTGTDAERFHSHEWNA